MRRTTAAYDDQQVRDGEKHAETKEISARTFRPTDKHLTVAIAMRDRGRQTEEKKFKLLVTRLSAKGHRQCRVSEK